jgi:hypothetical protein
MTDEKQEPKLNRKMYQDVGAACCKLRVWHRKERRIRKRVWLGPRFLVKCGCCDESIEVHYDLQNRTLEIGGVRSTTREWREFLLPLLSMGSMEEWAQLREGMTRGEVKELIGLPVEYISESGDEIWRYRDFFGSEGTVVFSPESDLVKAFQGPDTV